MNHPQTSQAPQPNDSWKLNTIAVLVAITGLITISSTLFALLHFRHLRIASADAHLTLLAGLSLIYLATLLNRGKRTAWLISIPIYIFLVIRNSKHFIFDFPGGTHRATGVLINLGIPVVTLLLLIYAHMLFRVRSSLRNFTTALTRSLMILLVAFVYGVVGFTVMDERDFHQEISPSSAAHYTVDQFGLTTNQQIKARSRRAQVFVDSLATISVGAVFYTGLALFSPIRFRLSHHRRDYQDLQRLLIKHATTSEDFFKIWPPDKAYFFNQNRTTVIAYKAMHGTALVVGDPLGPKSQVAALMAEFMDFCRVNDWRPALIHTEDTYLELYKSFGFDVQKIGEEAIISTENFKNQVAATKDFRHIKNKFDKLGYSCETLEPPHSPEVMQRLRIISNDWLSGPGRAERGFMMGYFRADYIQQCRLVVARDNHAQIQGFINQIPSPIHDEANFDFLRHSRGSPGNINDYLMLCFIGSLAAQGIPRLNMGLAPLSGLNAATGAQSGSLDRLLNFAYANGNRFYSFQGLKRFKTKYQPQWQSRYIVYRGGLRGFTKTSNSLMFAMRVRRSRR